MKPTSSAITIPGTQAQQAIDQANKLFPESGKGSGRIVFHSLDGTKLTDYADNIQKLLDIVSKTEGVSSVVSPLEQASFIDTTGTIGYASVQLDKGAGAVEQNTLDKVNDAVDAARQSKLEIEIGGGLVSQAPGEIIGVGEVGGVVLALIVLCVTLGSLVAAGMPIVSALVGIAISTLGLFSLSQVISINTTTPVLGIMLGLAVGIDYSLFIINKYRMLLFEGYSFEAACGRALSTAGNAVVFAALTVVIALAALVVVQIPFMSLMGLAGASSIAVAALVSLTVVPALLGIAGARVFTKKQRQKILVAQKHGPKKVKTINHSSFWYKWGAAITKHPLGALVAATIIVIVVAIPAKSLQLGLPTDQYAAATTTERKAYDLITKGFGVGTNSSLLVVVQGLPAVSAADKATVRQQAEKPYQEQVAAATAKQQAYFAQKAAAASTPGEQLALQQEIAAAQQAGLEQQAKAQETISATVAQYAKYVQINKVSENIAHYTEVAQAVPAVVVDNGTAGLIQVVPKSAPSDPATDALIKDLRDPQNQTTLSDAKSLSYAVTGATALQNDVNKKLADALPVYLAVVIGLSFILLTIAFRSILVPVTATLGFILSVLAMFGALVAVFQWGWFGIADAPGPIVSFIPIIAIGILFGLAMDYEFFLVSGMHESYTHSKKAKQAVLHGFAAGSKVVTAAGVIMISVFAGFITNHDVTIQAIGFGLAISILIDAFFIRMTIIPALMTLLGDNAWWLPKWLERYLPHVSIEGEE